MRKATEGSILYGSCSRSIKTPEVKPFAFSLSDLGLDTVVSVDAISVGFWMMKTSTTPDHSSSSSNDYQYGFKIESDSGTSKVMFLEFDDANSLLKAGMCYSTSSSTDNIYSVAWSDSSYNSVWYYVYISGRLSTLKFDLTIYNPTTESNLLSIS